MFVENVVIEYRDRPEGSESKLSTYSDGFKVLRTIFRLYRTYKPMNFYGILSLIMIILAACFFLPVLVTFAKTGTVPHFPTLIVCGFVVLAAITSFFAGTILSTLRVREKQEFEFTLKEIHTWKDR